MVFSSQMLPGAEGLIRCFRRMAGLFVARDELGRTVAAAHGAAPSRVRFVAAAETWALAKVSVVFFVGSAFRSDYLGVLQIFARWRHFATLAKQLCPAAWCQMF